MRVEAFIQARMGSTRLPGKVMKKVLGRPLLDFMIERLQQAKEIDAIVILTTIHPTDDEIVEFCQTHNIPCFRGSEDDVLDRFYQAALRRKPDAIVRLTADCPLIDPYVLDEVVRVYRENYLKIDYVSNTLKRTYPRGLDVEVFSYHCLEKTFQEAQQYDEREHVTLYIYKNPQLFHLKNVAHTPAYPHYRWTVDTSEDFSFVRQVIEHLYPIKPKFCMDDILRLLETNPALIRINAHIQQKSGSSHK